MALHHLKNFVCAMLPLASLGRKAGKGKKDAVQLWAEILEILVMNGKSIDENYFSKIRHYAVGFRIIGEWVATLRGYRLTDQEIRAGKCMSVCTPLFDAVFDEQGLTEGEIMGFLETEEAPQEGLMLIMKYYLNEILRNITNREEFHLYLNKLRGAQLKSIKQKDPAISEEELRSISFAKGGYALLLSRSIYQNRFKENEKDSFFQLGALIQYTNDIFDIHKDIKQGLITLPLYHKNISIIRNEYKDLLSDTLKKFQQTAYPERNINRFRYQLLIITGRALTCLDLLDKSFNGRLKPALSGSHREKFICDMDRFGNFLRSLLEVVGG